MDDEMSSTCSTHWKTTAYEILVENPDERNQLGDVGVDERTILK
jgi:hypothetical protein